MSHFQLETEYLSVSTSPYYPTRPRRSLYDVWDYISWPRFGRVVMDLSEDVLVLDALGCRILGLEDQLGGEISLSETFRRVDCGCTILDVFRKIDARESYGSVNFVALGRVITMTLRHTLISPPGPPGPPGLPVPTPVLAGYIQELHCLSDRSEDSYEFKEDLSRPFPARMPPEGNYHPYPERKIFYRNRKRHPSCGAGVTAAHPRNSGRNVADSPTRVYPSILRKLEEKLKSKPRTSKQPVVGLREDSSKK
eukprot:1187644-Amorphochlora_amoeboformis.AAC.1